LRLLIEVDKLAVEGEFGFGQLFEEETAEQPG